MSGRKRVIVLGGGYGGVNLARRIGDSVDVTVVSEDNFLLSTPMLAEVAAGYLDPRHIVTPLRQLCPAARVVQGTVTSIDPEEGRVTVHPPMGLDDVTLDGDAIVVAVGSVPADFGVEGVDEFSLQFKTINDALRIRNRVLALLESSTISDDENLTRVAVIGAGYSGAELAAALSDFVRDAAESFFPSAPPPRVTLIDALERVTPTLSADLSERAAEQLRERHVEIQLGRKVASIDAHGVRFQDGERIDAGTVVWAAGVRPNPLVSEIGLPTERGRLVVDGFLRASERVFGLGDAAAVPDGSGGISPPTAQFAVRQGKYLATHLPAILEGRAVPRFRYSTMGELVSLGYHNAVGRVLGIPVSGLPAWFLWRSYYLLQVPTMFRRARIAVDWTLDLAFPPDVAWLPSSDLGPDL